ncbi:histidine kinase [Paenibacillus sp. NEAU-GSW1]|uniref:histidine kinase n=1 Tax=Paenibacillus sp. NEAU-GSW1 TaxID=2682486 RepID=UPI00139BF35A|nr:sensor histidine kinase [Paenibacillus sp. NEAU-GSW1]
MNKWYQIFHKNTGLSPYVWIVFCILPFYFIVRSSSTFEIVTGVFLVLSFFTCYVLSFVSKGWPVYVWTGLQIAISITMTLLFGYAYFSIFLAFFIGNIQNKAGFISLYTVHLVTAFLTINYGFATSNSMLLTQFPFVLISLIMAILLPINNYNRNKQGKLEGELEDANKRISELVKLEERQRIARDLHDTIGQKLSLIGLKSDLAGRLVNSDPARALTEIQDVRQTARTALKEVRELVTQMRGTRLEDEVLRVQQMLKAAGVEFALQGEPKLENTSLLNENVLSMCLKEAVTNVVKHSRATACTLSIDPSHTDLTIRVEDNGIGLAGRGGFREGNGLRGMKERLEFVNGNLEISASGDGSGTALIIKVPNILNRT